MRTYAGNSHFLRRLWWGIHAPAGFSAVLSSSLPTPGAAATGVRPDQ